MYLLYMGNSPNNFVEENFEPSLGDVLVMKYWRDLGLSSEAATSTGRVMEIIRNDDDEFVGFTMSVEQSDHLKPEQDPKLTFQEDDAHLDMNVYLVWPDRTHKINAIPGDVTLEEVKSFS